MANKKVLQTYMGRVHKLAHNPNVMSDGAFTRLMESLLWKENPDDPEDKHSGLDFLAAKNFIIWMVPEELPKGRVWPFEGQEGKMVMLGGNWRYEALLQLGYDRIPDEWVKVAKYSDGKWWTPAAAERFILIDNSPEGISGENNFDELIKRFDEECMRAVGIDFAGAPIEWAVEKSESTEDKVEQGEHGEQDQKLSDFIKRREDSRGNLEEMLDMGFYTVTVFETHDQKMEYLQYLREKYGVEANREVFVNGFQMAAALGKKIEYSGLKFPESKPSAALQEMAMDGTREGWEASGGDLPEAATAEEEADSEKMDDGSGIDGVI